MSKLVTELALLQAKALVNAYTWTTLPIYALVQKPWRRLKLAKSFGVQTTKDQHGRTIYSRPVPPHITHPYLQCNSFNSMVPHLDRNWKIIGTRDVLSEVAQYDPATGEPIKIMGKELKQVKLAKDFHWYTVGEILDRADAFARGLSRMGVMNQDKVIIYAENSLEWFCAAIALLRMNAITVTLLSIQNDESIIYGINQSEARFIITSEELLNKLDRISDKLTHPKLNIIYIQNKFVQTKHHLLSLKEKFPIQTYNQVQADGEKVPPIPFSEPDPNDLCLIMYTSGTTGNPKGVMLSHENMSTASHNVIRMDQELDTSLIDTRYAAYLPMAHLYGYGMNMGLFVSKAKIGICSPLTMLDASPAHVPNQVGDIKLIKPELFGGVPLVLDRIIKEVYRKLNSRSSIAAPLFTYLMDYKIRWKARGYDSPIINRVICKKINQEFGGNFKIMLIGSAPLNERTQALGQAVLNIKMIQAYGSTEMSGISHGSHNNELNYGECGVPVHSVKYYLKDWDEGGYSTRDKPNPRGEIVVGGPTIAMGYYKMPEETNECFKVDEQGTRWFESGDIGEVLPNGTLKIIDRKKDLTKLANGEFVSLGKIESALRSSPYIENICICTDPYSNHVTALICPNRKSLPELGAKLGKSQLTFDQLCDDSTVIDHVSRSLYKIGKEMHLSRKEIPTRVTLVKEEWTPDSNLLTGAMKVKRKQVVDYYREQIKRMFDDGGSTSL